MPTGSSNSTHWCWMFCVLKLSIILAHIKGCQWKSNSSKQHAFTFKPNRRSFNSNVLHCIALQYVATAIATLQSLCSNINYLSDLSYTSVLNKISNQPRPKLEVDCTKVHFVTTNALLLMKPSIFLTADSDIDLEAFKRIQVDSSSLY